MSPQPSNRQALLEGALRCLMRMPLEEVSARAVASAASSLVSAGTPGAADARARLVLS